MRGKTIAYKSLYDKHIKDNSNSNFLLNTSQSLGSPNEIMMKILKLKKELILNIEEVLKEFQKEYAKFRVKRNFTHETLKEISEYFVQAVVKTMTNQDFRKALTEFQNLDLMEKNPLFDGNSDCFNYFNGKSMELRVKALTINWLVFIDDNLDVKLSSAANLSDPTLAALKLFKLYLKKEVISLKVITMLVQQMNKILTELILADQKQSLIFQNYIKATEKEKGEKVSNNFSLKIKILDFIKLSPMKPWPCDLLPAFQDKLATMIVKKIINRFSQDKEFYQKYKSSMAYINIDSTNDLYYSDKWKTSLENCFAELGKNNDFKRKIKATMDDSSIPKIVSLVEENVLECIKMLIMYPKLSAVSQESVEATGFSCL